MVSSLLDPHLLVAAVVPSFYFEEVGAACQVWHGNSYGIPPAGQGLRLVMDHLACGGKQADMHHFGFLGVYFQFKLLRCDRIGIRLSDGESKIAECSFHDRGIFEAPVQVDGLEAVVVALVSSDAFIAVAIDTRSIRISLTGQPGDFGETTSLCGTLQRKAVKTFFAGCGPFQRYGMLKGLCVERKQFDRQSAHVSRQNRRAIVLIGPIDQGEGGCIGGNTQSQPAIFDSAIIEAKGEKSVCGVDEVAAKV